jgi:hypothetical protein
MGLLLLSQFSLPAELLKLSPLGEDLIFPLLYAHLEYSRGTKLVVDLPIYCKFNEINCN